MSARLVIQTYRLASLHEAAIARLKNPKNDRYKELYLQNRGIGEKVYNAVLSGRLDLACFCGDFSKYYSVLTRSTRQDGALQVTEIDRVCRDELLRKQVQVLEMAKLVKEQPRAEGNAIIIRDIDFLML